MKPSWRYWAFASIAILAVLRFVGPVLVAAGWVRGATGAVVLSGLLAWLCGRLNLRALQVYCLLFCGLAMVVGVVAVVYVVVPVWLLITVAIASAIAYVVLLAVRGEGLKQKRAQMGLCEACGYDLRQSFDRCPECGGPIPTDLARRRRIGAQLRARRGGNDIVPDRSDQAVESPQRLE